MNTDSQPLSFPPLTEYKRRERSTIQKRKEQGKVSKIETSVDVSSGLPVKRKLFGYFLLPEFELILILNHCPASGYFEIIGACYRRDIEAFLQYLAVHATLSRPNTQAEHASTLKPVLRRI